ncbi:DUF58 domain-containing protein [Undibacterium sp. MH2W]|uniref:DUF58 domain-containing protein n=1 Tax=Undibacterium sp. MH2W TaxID=3413044 RepID=UPI003BF0E9E2
MLKSLRQRLRQTLFLERQPERGEVLLGQRRVFTLPSKPGWMFILVLLLMFITSTNYNLSLGFALTFVLASVAMVNAFWGFRNMAYLHLLAGPARAVFAGEETQYTVHLINRRNHQRFAIWVGFAEKGHPDTAVDIAPHSQTTLQLSYPTQQRGWQPIPRIRLQTWFPLGLLRVWSTWLPDTQALVYPRPEQNPPPLPTAGQNNVTALDGQSGHEDFAGVRAYQAGDAMKHLAWKQIARVDTALGGQLVTKQFSGGTGSNVMIDYASLPRVMDTELKLARLTSWVLEADRTGLPYGFRIGSSDFAPAQGPAHRDACLRALALFEM